MSNDLKTAYKDFEELGETRDKIGSLLRTGSSQPFPSFLVGLLEYCE